MQVMFDAEALEYIRQNGGNVFITFAEAMSSCCGAVQIPYVSLGAAGEFENWRVEGINVYVQRGIKTRQNLKVRLDVVWHRQRLVADWV